MKLNSLIGSLLCIFAISIVSNAQSTSVSGDIRGTITDPSGAVLAKVTVTATDPQTGLRRNAASDTAGQYRLTGLPPGSYDLMAQLPGFATGIRRGIAVSLGRTVVSDFQLKVSSVAVQIEVNDAPALVETEKGSQVNSVPAQYISDLPIDRRDYLTFTLLMPGVSNSNALANNADFRVKQTPQSGMSLYGSNGRGNSISVDGGEANDDAGGVRLNVSQDSVREFQINRSNYSAELGSASGASVNIVTKSGTNTSHGSLYGFFRNDALDARDPFAFRQALSPDPTFANFNLTSVGTPVKNSLNRQQFGGTFGFPIRKDKTFLFVGYEGLRSDAQDSVPLLTQSSIFAPTISQQRIGAGLAALGSRQVPCLSGPVGNEVAAQLPPPYTNMTTLPADFCGAVLGNVLTINPAAGPMDAFVVSQFEKDGGLFPFPIRQHQASTRVDHHFGNHDQGALRYSFSHLRESDPDVQALTAFSRGSSILNWDSTVQASWFHQFNANLVNEARAQWNWYQFNVDTNDAGGPGLDVQGYGFFGRGIFLPSHTTARRYELGDNLTVIRGRHSMRTGFYELIRGNNTVSDTFFAGRFEFLELPGFLLSPCMSAPAACDLGATTAPTPISTLQSWSLGLPAFYEQGFGDPRYAQTRPFTAAYWQDTWQLKRGLTLNYGFRYELDSQPVPLSTYKKNFGPRVSFAWDPFGDNRTVVRGGYGIFYSPIYFQIPDVLKTLGNINDTRQIANALVTLLGVPGGTNPYLNSAAIYQLMFAQGKILCGKPPASQNSCISSADLAAPPISLQINNTGSLPPGTVLFFGQRGYRNPQSQQASLGFEHEIGNGLTVSANYIYVHTTHLPWAIDANLLPGAPFTTDPTTGASFENWGAPECAATPSLCFADPTRTILQNNEYASVANAVYHGGILEIKKRFTGGFTLQANYTYSKAIDDSTDFNSDYAAFNEVDLRAERSLSDFDQRHKFVFAAVVDSPWKRSPVLSGFELSPIVSYNSGHPFNLLAGADVNGDNHFTNDRPPGAPRNSGLGPEYLAFDLRLSHTLKLGEQRRLRFVAEAFNVTNRTNYARVNNIVGDPTVVRPPFRVHGTSSLTPSQPLGFTSAMPMREIQLGVRFDF
jgi:hypothetical protein